MPRIAAIMLFLLPAAAEATPVYLKCRLNATAQGGAGPGDLLIQAPMDVTLNEDASTVTYSFPQIGRAFTVPGMFTADKVAFNGFTVDRTNLAFQRDMSGLRAPGRTPLIDRGECTLVHASRAF